MGEMWVGSRPAQSPSTSPQNFQALGTPLPALGWPFAPLVSTFDGSAVGPQGCVGSRHLSRGSLESPCRAVLMPQPLASRGCGS